MQSDELAVLLGAASDAFYRWRRVALTAPPLAPPLAPPSAPRGSPPPPGRAEKPTRLAPPTPPVSPPPSTSPSSPSFSLSSQSVSVRGDSATPSPFGLRGGDVVGVAAKPKARTIGSTDT